MATHVRRSIEMPIRAGSSWEEKWRGEDHGLICCWERGRLRRIEEPALAARADKGELVPLGWKRAVKEKGSSGKRGTHQYLATWQGLRGEDLDIVINEETRIVCAKTGDVVIFSARVPVEEDEAVPDDER